MANYFLTLMIYVRLRNDGLVYRRDSSTSWEESTTLTLGDFPSNDDVIMKAPYGVDVLLNQPSLHPIFSNWVGQLRTLVVAAIDVNVYPFLACSDLAC